MEDKTNEYSIEEIILANLQFVGEAKLSHVKAGARNRGCTEKEVTTAIQNLIEQGKLDVLRPGIIEVKDEAI